MAADRPRSKDQVTDPDHTDPRAAVPEERTDTDPARAHEPTRIEEMPTSRPGEEPAAKISTDPTPANADPTRMEPPPDQRPGAESRPEKPAAKISTDPTPASADPTRMEPPPDKRPGAESRPTKKPAPVHEATRVQPAPTSRPVESTMRTSVVPKVRLVVKEGDQPERVYELAAGTHIIGRSEEASLCIYDVGASRRHAELTVSAEGLRLKDLGSGNGTIVNDTQQTEVMLQPGDLLKIGGHIFEVQIEAGAAVPARVVAPVPSVAALRKGTRRGRPSDRLLVLMAIFGAIAVLLTAYGLTRRKHVDPLAEQRARHEQAAKIFRKGMEAFRAEQWDGALASFEKAVSLHPGHESAGRYLQATKREKEAAAAIAEAVRGIERNDLAAAQAALSRISPDAVLAEKIPPLQAQIDQQKLGDVLEAFRDALDAIDPMTVMAELFVPEGTSPVDRARLELAALEEIDLSRAESVLDEARERAPDSPEIDVAREKLAVRRQGISTATAEKQQQIKDLEDELDESYEARVRRAIARTMAPARSAFAAGNFPEAARVLKAGPSSQDDLPEVQRVVRAAYKALPRYQKAIQRAQLKEAARDYQGAGGQFTSAYNSARKIDAEGRLAREASAGAVRMRYLGGRNAFNQERWKEAYVEWRKGQRLDPKDENIVKGLADLEEKAKNFYLQAYVEKNTVPDRARKGFKTVLKMTSSESEWNRKAREQMSTMGGY